MMHANKTPVVFRLVCVRHGETDANKEFRIQGHIDVPLNELGREQARRVGVALSSYKWTRVYTSDLQRAQQTASIILQHSKSTELPPITVDKRIKERNFGRFENMLLADVRAEMKDKKTAWFEFTPEGAETMGEVQDRFVNFFKTLCQSVYDKYRHTQSSCNGDSCVTSNGATLDETADESILQRDSSSLDTNSIGVKDVCETVLMVSHGAALRQLYCHLGSTLACSFPGRVEEHPRNSAFTSFTVRYSPRSYALVCHEHNNANHLDGLSD